MINAQTASEILAHIKQAKSILLHLHPSPDPDSVGSALAMKFAIESIASTQNNAPKVTIARGDSPTPASFSDFPGYASIVPHAVSDADFDLNQFDLFIMQDSGSFSMVSGAYKDKAPADVFPAGLKTIVIDHHASNTGYAKDLNVIDTSYPATAQMLYDLFVLWGITITPEIAANLFIGMFTDTGGFRYKGTTSHTLAAASVLAGMYPDFPKLIFAMDNQNEPESIIFKGLALQHIEHFLNDHLALSFVSNEDLVKNNINESHISAHSISYTLISVVGWDVGVAIIEVKPKTYKLSFRTRNPEQYDLSIIAKSIGGGGHKAAAGATLVDMTAEEVKKNIVDAVAPYVR